MINLSKRSYTSELMDRDDIPFADMARTLRELNVINTRLGGHSITTDGFREISEEDRDLVVCEIGCGGGDNLNALDKFAKKKGLKVRFIGIDKNLECIQFAQQQYPQMDCQWICSDYAKVHFSTGRPDILFSSLFCHHFTDESLVEMIGWLKNNSSRGFFINDLHRHWLAYYLIQNITRIFSRSYLVKNDAALSVARSFKRKDWDRLFNAAGVTEYSIRWRWAFRWLVTVKN